MKINFKLQKMNSAVFLFIYLIIAVIGIWWLTQKDLLAGKVYLTMFTTASIMVLLAFFSFKIDNFKVAIQEIYSASVGKSSLYYLIGFFGGIILNFVIKLFSGFNITSVSIPLMSSNILSGINQSFSAVELSESMAWKLFIIVFCAGILEEFIFLFGATIIGVPIGSFFNKFIFDNKYGKYFILLFAFAFSVLLFGVAHKLNGTYTTIGMFAFAMGFRLISLISVYVSKIPVITNYYFWVGYHMANNLMFLISIEGFINVLNGFFSFFGLVFIGLIFINGYFSVRNFDKTKREMEV